MELNSLTNKPTKPKKTIQPKYRDKKPIKKTYIPEVGFSLDLETTYKGINDNIMGVIHSLPTPLKSLLGNAELNSVKASHKESIFILDNRWYLKVQHKNFNRQPHILVILKEKHKEHLRRYIKI